MSHLWKCTVETARYKSNQRKRQSLYNLLLLSNLSVLAKNICSVKAIDGAQDDFQTLTQLGIEGASQFSF